MFSLDTCTLAGQDLSNSGVIEPVPCLTDIDAEVAVVGGGIAGVWAALKLASRGIPTVLVTYKANDRGGVQGATRRSVGAVSTMPIKNTNFAETLEEMSRGQANVSIAKHLTDRLPAELEALRQYTDLEEITIGVRVEGGNSRGLLERLCEEFTRQGGTIIYGWVTRLAADAESCKGLQYQTEEGIGKLRAKHLVIASGGYAALFDGAVHTACHGTVLGQFMQAGGGGVNLEFLFKHGYGKPDMGQLTPTEELRGAEIFDTDRQHVQWLERELFDGNGTHNHQKALRFWRQNRDKRYFVSLRCRPLFKKVQAINRLFEDHRQSERVPAADLLRGLRELMNDVLSQPRKGLRQRIAQRLRTEGAIDYDMYCDLRRCSKYWRSEPSANRIRQIPYFSMGGAAHLSFKTNLRNVYVTGEAMHDFGANRVGGLPWGLYLVAGEVIAEQIATERARSPQEMAPEDFEIVRGNADFDPGVLKEIRRLLHDNQESSFNPAKAQQAVSWIRATRRCLLRSGRGLNDAVSWLIVAEGIFQASLARQESRGCFMRDDFLDESVEFDDRYTYCYYDDAADKVVCQVVSKSDFQDFFERQSRQQQFSLC